MNFNMSQLKEETNWWQELFFYFAVLLFSLSIVSYFIFFAKIYSQASEMAVLDKKINEIGTEKQKEEEKQLLSYKSKITDFSRLIESHRISSNIFNFLEQRILPNVWFSKFSMQDKSGEVNLEGEAETLEILSRQVTLFEDSDFVDKVNVLSSSIGESGRISFRISFILDEKLFIFEIPPDQSNIPDNITEENIDNSQNNDKN